MIILTDFIIMKRIGIDDTNNDGNNDYKDSNNTDDDKNGNDLQHPDTRRKQEQDAST